MVNQKRHKINDVVVRNDITALNKSNFTFYFYI
jgi:hypothetical protein